MKERRHKAGRRVDSGKVWSLFQIARPTDQCEIGQAGRSAMLPGDDVLDVESAAERLLR